MLKFANIERKFILSFHLAITFTALFATENSQDTENKTQKPESQCHKSKPRKYVRCLDNFKREEVWSLANMKFSYDDSFEYRINYRKIINC